MPVRSCGAACQVEMLDDTTLLLPWSQTISEPLIRAEPMGLQGPSETCRNKATKVVLM